MLIAYLLTGALAGTLSGLLGIGGIIVVPLLAAFFKNPAIPTAIYEMAIGTSLILWS